MPKAVAILEGNSDGLVKSIKKAKDEMLSLEAGGKTLSRQLKDVATEADKAAGSLVNRIGGGTAIKAIGGLTVGMTAATTALGVFSGSMQAFAATQGEEGAKAMADIDNALNQLQGQLFTAVMGTDSMKDASAALITVIDGATRVVQGFLSPLKLLTGSFWDNQEGAKEAAAGIDDYNAAVARTKDSTKLVSDNVSSLILQVTTLTGKTKDLTAAKVSDLKLGLTAELTNIETIDKAQDERIAKSVVEASRIRNEERARTEWVKQHHRIRREDLEDIAKLADKYDKEVYDAQIARLQKLSPEREKQAQRLREGIKELDAFVAGGMKRPDEEGQRTGPSASAKRAAEDAKEGAKELAKSIRFHIRGIAQDIADAPGIALGQMVAAIRVQEAKDLAQATSFAAERAKVFGDATSAQVQSYLDAKTTQEIADIEAFNAARQRAIEEHDMNFNLSQDASKWAEEQRSKEKAASDEKIAGIEAGMKAYGSAAAQQLVTGKKAAKVAEDLARQAIGGQISALGDEAMAKAAIYAASFNPMAIPMAAAGVAAYAAAAALGSSAKKASSGTPAAAAPVQAAPVNTSFNLRVDAAFADGESIARQFAMMQQAAQRRGLVPVGA